MTARASRLPDVARATVTTSTATAYHFEFTHGWACFTVNDATGELGVQSDWGTYAYRWSAHPKHLGAPTLTAFLRTAEPYYLADKLHYGRPRDREEFDSDSTRHDLRKRVGELYADQRLTKAQVRNVLYAIDDLEMDSGPELFMQSFCDGPECLRQLTHDPYEWIRSRPTYSFMVLYEALLPAFLAHLRAPATP